MKWFCIILYQAWPKCGPRATCGPPTFICGPPTFFIIKKLKLHSCYRPKGIKNDKMWLQSPKVKNLQPAIKNIFKIWPASKKVWPPLFYILLNTFFAILQDEMNIKTLKKLYNLLYFFGT